MDGNTLNSSDTRHVFCSWNALHILLLVESGYLDVTSGGVAHYQQALVAKLLAFIANHNFQSCRKMSPNNVNIIVSVVTVYICITGNCGEYYIRRMSHLNRLGVL